MNPVSAANPNLYLVGFMGVGKSTVGRAAAIKLGFDFFDSDHEIERISGMVISDIFEKQGEAAFRAMERSYIESGSPVSGSVIACGGGLIVQPGMPELVRSKGVVICLHASFETILSRVAGHKHRPLLNVDDQDKQIRTLFEKRDPIYRKAGTNILTDRRPMHDIVAHVLRAYHREAAEWSTLHRANA